VTLSGYSEGEFMKKSNVYFGIDWTENTVALSSVIGLFLSGLINIFSSAFGYTDKYDTWWVIGSVLITSILIGFVLLWMKGT